MTPSSTTKRRSKVQCNCVPFRLFPNHQHLVSNTQRKVDGVTLAGRVMCFNPMEMAVEGGTQTFILGIWYVDEFARVDGRWLFASRKQEASWNLNFPEYLKPV